MSYLYLHLDLRIDEAKELALALKVAMGDEEVNHMDIDVVCSILAILEGLIERADT